MKSYVVIFLLIHANESFGFFGRPTLEFLCDKSHGTCILHNVVLESESDLDRVSFPNISDPLTISSGKIPHFTRKLVGKLSNVVDLTVNHLEVETLYVKPEMTHLAAVGNRIITLLVENDRSKIYEMLTLDLSNNSLQDVEVLSRFNKIHQLTLDGNHLESLTLDLFKDMSELRKLSLANNKMYTFETRKNVHLPKLRSLSLAGNTMIELDITMWDLPSLRELDLSNNKFYMLDGSLKLFKTLEEVKLSENYWKCDTLKAVVDKNTFTLDKDQPKRCGELGMTNLQQICCTYDASSILGSNTGGDLGLFNDKWDELRNLQESFHEFKNSTDKKLHRIGKLPEDRSLVDRIEQLESTQKELLEKLNDRQESVAVNEMNELRSVVADHKNTIENLESKQSELESQLENIVEKMNDLRDNVKEKLEKLDEIPEKVQNLEQTKSQQATVLDKQTAEIEETIKGLQVQQLKYHLSSVDLKSQIGTERARLSGVQSQLDKLSAHNEKLYSLVDQANYKIEAAWNMLDLINDNEN